MEIPSRISKAKESVEVGATGELESNACAENFPLQGLSRDLQNLVIEKLTFNEWSSLRQTSWHSYVLCESVRSRLPWRGESLNLQENKLLGEYCYISGHYMGTFPWDFATTFPCRLFTDIFRINDKLTSEKLKELQEEFSENRTLAQHIDVQNGIECSTSELASLIEVLDSTSFACSANLNIDFFDYPIAQNLTQIDAESCRISEEQLLKLRAKRIFINGDSISTKAINQFLKEWARGDREILDLDISFSTTIGFRAEDEMIADLSANPIWSSSWHSSSLLSKISLYEIRELWEEDPRSFYCLWRSSAINDLMVLEISRGRISFASDSIDNCILSLLSEDQYYNIFHRCMLCWYNCSYTGYCHHRAKYCIPRIFRRLPRSLKAVLSLLKVSKMLLTGYNIFSGHLYIIGV